MLRTRIVLGVTAVLTIILLAVFAVGLQRSQAADRHQIETELRDRAVLASSLLDSVYQQSAHAVAATQSSDPAIPTSAALESAEHLYLYATITDATGRVLVSTPGFTAEARASLGRDNVSRAAATGAVYALGDLIPYGSTRAADFAVPFRTTVGMRVLILGIDLDAIKKFDTAALTSIPGVYGSQNTLLDSNDVILSSTSPRATVGDRPNPTERTALTRPSGQVDDMYFAASKLPNTSWRIVLAAPTTRLFASVSGVHRVFPWLLFSAFAAFAVLVMYLGYRVTRSTRRLREVNGRLGVANAELSDLNEILLRRAEELARSNEELDQFASIASHDLQEPLRKVRMFTQQLAVVEDGNLSEQGSDYAERANAAASRMQALIDGLLSYARVATAGRAFARTDLHQVVTEALDDLALSVEESGATVQVGPLPVLSGDAVQLRQLVQNLVANAIKFRRPDVPLEVSLTARVDGDRAIVEVTDNGIGFDAQYAERIFKVFERLHGRSAYEGTGIGLALCRKIAERHGGSVVAVGHPGEGATFTVTLPYDHHDQTSEVAPPDQPHQERGVPAHA